jgi:hypothetical protein
VFPPSPLADSSSSRFWLVLTFALALPLVALIGATIWRMPLPVTETVALLEDVSQHPAGDFLIPETSYYRPAYHMTLHAIWHSRLSIAEKVHAIKLMQIVPFVLLVAALIAYLRPRSALDAAAALVAVSVLLGSPGLWDNLEIPLSYTIVGMPAALLAWWVLNRPPRWWTWPVVLAMTILAVGFKEQGLVVMAVMVAAWWTGAPAASRRMAVTFAVLAIAYVLFRLAWRERWPMFEQAIGVGFQTLEPPEAVRRYGAFPYFIYAYSSLSTMLNVLFSEPVNGVFGALSDLLQNDLKSWQVINVLSSLALTLVIVRWSFVQVSSVWRTRTWPLEARVAAALVAALLGCGVLSFNYSRARLGGMAVVFYVLAAYFALRATVTRAAGGSRLRFAMTMAVVVAIACGWQIRAVATLEHLRWLSQGNQVQWVLTLPKRQADFAERPAYIDVLGRLTPQGADPSAPHPTVYPEWVAHALGLP